MTDKNFVRGLVLIAISAAFGLPALRYPIGTFGRAGAGLFPLMVCSVLLLIGIATVIRSRIVEKVPMDFQIRNIAIILGSLCGFALISHYINMLVGIVFMVFCSSFAASSYSIARNVKIAAGLIAIAFAFRKLLGLSLPLY